MVKLFGLAALLIAGVCAAKTTSIHFSIADRVLLAEYRLLERSAPMIFALQPEWTAAVAAALQKRGAQVIGRRDEIGYLFALIPLDAVASVLELRGLQAVQVTSMPMRSQMGAPQEQSAAVRTSEPRVRGTPPLPSLLADNPFTAQAATQALEFKSRNPIFDGRGVVTAFVEPIAPNLNTMHGALAASGQPLPKFSRYDLRLPQSAAEPIAAEPEIWQRTDQVTPDDQAFFNWRGRTYRLPMEPVLKHTGAIQWRMCRRLPHPHSMNKEEYEVLWDVKGGMVWVLPSSLGTDFTKARSTSLATTVAWVATADPMGWSPDPFAPLAFVFKADRKRYWLGFASTQALHAGMVGSVMAGSSFLGSQADGVAPAAQIAIFHGAPTRGAPSHTGIEQMLDMLTDRRVHVAESSYVVSDSGRFADDALHAVWVNRLIGKSGKPFIKAVGNFGPSLFGVQEFALAEEVFTVGAFIPREAWRANFGIDPAGTHTLASLSGYGPGRDGGLKPDFLALTSTLSEGHLGRWYWQETPGFDAYGVSGGTSAAAPHGAGHVALLVSAAKQTGIPHDVARLRAAIASSAKFLEGVEARAQGHGLIQVSDAWEALRRAKNWKPASFTVRAPVVSAESKVGGAERFVGRGLFELSGWRPGQKGRRELAVTRTGGSLRSDRYRLRWKGSTEALSSALHEIELPLGVTVTMPLEIKVNDSGSYSAIVDFIDPSVNLIAGSVLCTVLVADPLVAGAVGLHYSRESPRPGNSLFHVEVPPGLTTISVKVTKDKGRSLWSAQDPTGRSLPFQPYGSEVLTPPQANANAKASEQQFVYTDPVPGVWQFRLWNIEPMSMDELNEVDWSRPLAVKVDIQGWAESVESIGDAAQVLLNPGIEPAFYDINVAPGAPRLEVWLEHEAVDARVGLYVFKAPQGKRLADTLNTDDTALVYYDPSFQSRKRYTLARPPAGRYRIVLDPLRVPARGLKVAYRIEH